MIQYDSNNLKNQFTFKVTNNNMMNAPHKDVPAKPSKFYLDGILEGCKDNQIPTESVMEAVKRTRQEVKKEKNRYAR